MEKAVTSKSFLAVFFLNSKTALLSHFETYSHQLSNQAPVRFGISVNTSNGVSVGV